MFVLVAGIFKGDKMEIDDILEGYSGEIRKVIDIADDVVVAILLADRDGAISQDEDNIGEFILLSDIEQ